MIAVLVRDQDSVERVRILADLRHASRDFARAQAGIDQHPRAVGDHQHGVAG